MLSRMVPISLGGMIWRMASSTWAKYSCGLLDARAGRAADVQADLPGVDRREEVVADQREQQRDRPDHQHDEAGDDRARGVPAPGEQPAVAPAELLELAVERVVDAPDQVQRADEPARDRQHRHRQHRPAQDRPVDRGPLAGGDERAVDGGDALAQRGAAEHEHGRQRPPTPRRPGPTGRRGAPASAAAYPAAPRPRAASGPWCSCASRCVKRLARRAGRSGRSRRRTSPLRRRAGNAPSSARACGSAGSWSSWRTRPPSPAA